MISLIITVLNEKDTLPEWFASIKKQTQQPDEIVLIDGGSSDGTWEQLQKYASQSVVIKQSKGNISHGRNAAIRKAKGDVIVATDAGCVYADTWFEELVKPILSGKADFATTGFGPWLNTSDTFVTHLIAAVTIPKKAEFSQKGWLASSRSVAFLRSVWDTVGGYPEWIPICEDVIFDLKIKSNGFREAYILEPLVSWRPRTNLSSFCKQLFRYTKSDGHGKLFFGRQLLRYVVYLGAIVLLMCGTALCIVVLLAGICLYSYKFLSRWWSFTKSKTWTYRLVGSLCIPFMLGLGDVAKMAGWPIGVFERKSGKIRYQSL